MNNTQTSQNISGWISAAQLAKICDVNRRDIYRKLQLLPSYKVCGARVFRTCDLPELKKLLSKNKSPAT